MNLSNKTVVITGASTGLGRALALGLCRHGANLVLIARNEAALSEVGKEIEGLTGKRSLCIPCDVANECQVARMTETVSKSHPRVDVLVNNAGIGIHKPFEAMTNEEMRRQYEVNCFGPFYCLKALLPSLKRSDSAYVLNVGSLAGEVSFSDNGLYASTKAALGHFSNSLRAEMRKCNIRIGLFLPGLMDTAFSKNYAQEKSVPPFMILDPAKAAREAIRMIKRRKDKKYMHKWMLFPMKFKEVFGGKP